MKRGDVYWTDFSATVGGEIRKQRPAVIVSNDTANKMLNRVQVVPLTKNTERVYPCEAIIFFAETKAKAMADQLTTISKARLIRQAGKVSADDLNKIAAAIKLQLELT